MERLLANLQTSVVGRIDKIEVELKTHNAILTNFKDIEKELQLHKEQIIKLQTELKSVHNKCDEKNDSVQNAWPARDLVVENRQAMFRDTDGKFDRSSFANNSYPERGEQSISINRPVGCIIKIGNTENTSATSGNDVIYKKDTDTVKFNNNLQLQQLLGVYISITF